MFTVNGNEYVKLASTGVVMGEEIFLVKDAEGSAFEIKYDYDNAGFEPVYIKPLSAEEAESAIATYSSH